MHGPRSGLLTILIPLLIGSLALAACNSNSVSGNQPKASSSTNAEGHYIAWKETLRRTSS